MIWLNSCSGAAGSASAPLQSTAAELVRAGVPAVIANQLPISDSAATQLARSFYRALAEGLPVDWALSEARAMLGLSLFEALEWATPVLFMRAPDGVLFTLGQPAAQQPAASAPPGFTNHGTSIGHGANMSGATINLGDIAGGDISKGSGVVNINTPPRRSAAKPEEPPEEDQALRV
jgi:hypothetical protein